MLNKVKLSFQNFEMLQTFGR